MKFIASNHAIFRLAERNIDVENAKKIVRNPSLRTKQSDGKIISSGTLADGRKLCIVHVNEGNKVTIITGYYEN